MGQYSTFYLDANLYGIAVDRVQEVVKPLPLTPVPLAPHFVGGLINLRGQVVTVIKLRELFSLSKHSSSEEMYVVCPFEGGGLVALQVDAVGDVVDFNEGDQRPPPETITKGVREFLAGIFKGNNSLMSVIDMNILCKHLVGTLKRS